MNQLVSISTKLLRMLMSRSFSGFTRSLPMYNRFGNSGSSLKEDSVEPI